MLSLISVNVTSGTGRNSVVIVNGDGVELTMPGAVADEFSKHFSSVATRLDAQIPPLQQCPIVSMEPPVAYSFFAAPATVAEVLNLIKSFPNKGTSLSEVPCYIYEQLASLLSPTIAFLFKKCLTGGLFPSCLKVARIIPIFKSGEKNNVKNYRPISTLPFLSKLFEKLMFVRLSTYLKKKSSALINMDLDPGEVLLMLFILGIRYC